MALRSWFDRLRGIATPPPAPEPELPDFINERADGTLEAKCRSCGCWYELPCDLAEFDPDYSYCGGSGRCIP